MKKRGLGAEEGECERLEKTVGRLNLESNFRCFNTELNMAVDDTGNSERGR